MRIIHCPKLDDVMRTQSDETLVKLFEKASNKLKQPDPEELSRNDFMEFLVDTLATGKACIQELNRRGKGHLVPTE